MLRLCVDVCHYSNVIMSAMASQITGVSMVCSTVCPGAGQKKTSKLRVTGLLGGIHRRPVNSPNKGPVTRKMLPFDDVIVLKAASFFQGKEICFCYNEDSFTIVDVTNKEHPKMVSKRGYLHSMYTHQVSGDKQSLHQLSHNRTIAYSGNSLKPCDLFIYFHTYQHSFDFLAHCLLLPAVALAG